MANSKKAATATLQEMCARTQKTLTQLRQNRAEAQAEHHSHVAAVSAIGYKHTVRPHEQVPVPVRTIHNMTPPVSLTEYKEPVSNRPLPTNTEAKELWNR